ncbi:MAG TPA: hypothetical protein VFH95_00515 [Candidatus Kapabacteria bacterium]|nr:hypothetical protein [Candidatus Kapabacteria bacterium]
MQTFSTEATIRREGELHLQHIPFHPGEKVKIIIVPSDDKENAQVRQAEYDAFMKGYAEGDNIYDVK